MRLDMRRDHFERPHAVKTLTQIQAQGYRVERRVALERGGPYNNERALPLALPAETDVRRFLRNESTQAPSMDALRQLDAARRNGEVVLLEESDFTSPPCATRFTETAVQRFGGPGGHYPWWEQKPTLLDSISLTDVVRASTGIERATWAIRPQVGAWPDQPELYIFVPVFDGDALNTSDAEDVLFTPFGEVPQGRRPDQGGIQVEEGSVRIGGVRVDRRNAPSEAPRR